MSVTISLSILVLLVERENEELKTKRNCLQQELARLRDTYVARMQPTLTQPTVYHSPTYLPENSGPTLAFSPAENSGQVSS